MVGQYPHELSYDVNGPKAPFTDGNGDWKITEGSGAIKTVKCRAEMNGNNRTISLTDGSKGEYSYLLYLPKGTVAITEGSIVTVKDSDRLICKAPVKQFHKGQLNCKLYV